MMRVTCWSLACLLAFASFGFGVGQSFADGLAFSKAENRIADSKPKSGPFVATEKGFMVPYLQRIPGTDVSIEMIPIPGGKEGPKPFWMGRFEIMMGQFRPYMKLYRSFRDAEDRAESEKRKRVLSINQVDAVTAPTEVYDPSFRFEYADDPNAPAPSMTQFSARQYTKWLSLVSGNDYRLPTLSEWQHACRGGTKTRWSFGNDESELSKYAVYWEDPKGQEPPLKVGARKPNPFGIHDMHGNLWEWVIDDRKKKAHYQSHLMCGGSWMDDPAKCRSDSIQHCDEAFWEEDPNIPLSPWWLASSDAQTVGFRIICPLVKDPEPARQLNWNTDSDQLRDDVKSRVEEARGAVGVVSKPR